MTKKSTFVTLSIFLLWLITATGYAQFGPFTTDSIPVVEDEVVFTYHFKGNLSKEEIHTRMHYYLDRELDPYSGAFLKNTRDSVVCQIIDYLEIESNLLHVFGMYMTYDMKFVFKEGSCDLTISHIIFMEKSHFEKQEKTSREFYFQEFTGKEIMIDKSYTQLLRREASDKITDAAIKRLNEIVRNLRTYFVD
ncbi:MAG: hypothetical protein JJE08_08070 [Proteiniphilum sp.]|nr:hypothetical protein [Proteiniphilum sp.]